MAIRTACLCSSFLCTSKARQTTHTALFAQLKVGKEKCQDLYQKQILNNINVLFNLHIKWPLYLTRPAPPAPPSSASWVSLLPCASQVSIEKSMHTCHLYNIIYIYLFISPTLLTLCCQPSLLSLCTIYEHHWSLYNDLALLVSLLVDYALSYHNQLHNILLWFLHKPFCLLNLSVCLRATIILSLLF